MSRRLGGAIDALQKATDLLHVFPRGADNQLIVDAGYGSIGADEGFDDGDDLIRVPSLQFDDL